MTEANAQPVSAPISTPADPSLVYLAGIGRVRDLLGFVAPGLEPDQRSRIVSVGTLAAIVVDVPAPMFLGADAESRLGDLVWLAPRAEAHERIVRLAMDRGPIMPAQFGAVFSSIELVQRVLLERAAEVDGFLAEALAHAEMSVKVLVSRRASPAEEQPARADDEVSGAGYLVRKRVERDAASVADARIESLIDSATDLLEPMVVDAADCRVVDRGEGDRRVARSWSFWVPNERIAAFESAVDQLSAQHQADGIVFEAGGPWPAYSFAPKLSS